MEGRLKELLEEDRSKPRNEQKPSLEIKKTELEANDLFVDADGIDLANPVVTSSPYDQARYFDEDYRPTLIGIAKEILSEKNGITIHELALDIANLHGRSRTSKKQMQRVNEILAPWAGILDDGTYKPVVWSSPDEIVDEIAWRGLDPWGYERDWTDLPYPEAKGLARLALQEQPDDPVDYICNVFGLKRRYEQTLREFQGWVDEVSRSRKA
jgi:hypothetical protein